MLPSRAKKCLARRTSPDFFGAFFLAKMDINKPHIYKHKISNRIRGAEIVDAFERQIKELYFIDNPQYIGEDKESIYGSSHFGEYKKGKERVANYIYMPWLNLYIKSVNNEDYFQLLTNRNHDLVTPDEQLDLYDLKIAVFGMSVGSNIAFTLAQSGIAREMIVADYDELDTTNLNRLSAGLHEVGLNKTHVAARKIYEMNPYTSITQLDHGISLDEFEKILKAKKLDVVFEEIDNLKLKLDIRALARKHKIPVIMITDNGDGVVLHIERYDLGYNKFFNKSQSYWKEKLSKITGAPDVGEIIMNDIIGGVENMHPRVPASVAKVLKKELISWSQLGTAAILGGVVSTVAVKQIFCDNDKRKYVHECINLGI